MGEGQEKPAAEKQREAEFEIMRDLFEDLEDDTEGDRRSKSRRIQDFIWTNPFAGPAAVAGGFTLFSFANALKASAGVKAKKKNFNSPDFRMNNCLSGRVLGQLATIMLLLGASVYGDSVFRKTQMDAQVVTEIETMTDGD